MTVVVACFFFFKQKTAYEMRISDWSSDVCSSDLVRIRRLGRRREQGVRGLRATAGAEGQPLVADGDLLVEHRPGQVAGEVGHVGADRIVVTTHVTQIGRASCRERVCQYV